MSSVKGFLKYKVLMKSCLVGEQYRLTHLLKKVLFKVRKHQLQVFQREEQVLSYGRGAEQYEIQRDRRAGNRHPML